jgi:Ca2+-binding EF-hand superfamily protein
MTFLLKTTWLPDNPMAAPPQLRGFYLSTNNGERTNWNSNIPEKRLTKERALEEAKKRTGADAEAYQALADFFHLLDADGSGSLEGVEINAVGRLFGEKELTKSDLTSLEKETMLFQFKDFGSKFRVNVGTGTEIKTGKYESSMTWGAGTANGELTREAALKQAKKTDNAATATFYSKIAQSFSRLDVNNDGKLDGSELHLLNLGFRQSHNTSTSSGWRLGLSRDFDSLPSQPFSNQLTPPPLQSDDDSDGGKPDDDVSTGRPTGESDGEPQRVEKPLPRGGNLTIPLPPPPPTGYDDPPGVPGASQ